MAEPIALTAEHHEGAADVFADAFLDDPGWVSVCPRGPRARRAYIRRTCRVGIRVADRWCGPSWCIVEAGRVSAVLVGCAPGQWPPPRARAAAQALPGLLGAGPRTLVRSVGAERVFERHHPDEPHFLVWMFAVHPSRQRAGLGRALMTRALAEADAAAVPAYLWTANPANLPYYGSHGFTPFAEERVPGGAPNWFMLRPAR